MIAGFRFRWPVVDAIVALERKRGSASTGNVDRDRARLASIEEQLAVYRAELEGMEKTGEGEEEPVTASTARGSSAWVGFRGTPPSVAG